MAKPRCNRCGRLDCTLASARTRQMTLLTRPPKPSFEEILRLAEDARLAQDACDTALAERRIERRRRETPYRSPYPR